MLAEAPAELRGDNAEVGDLHRIVLGDAAQLVVPRQTAVTRRDVERDCGVGEVVPDLRVGPVPAVAPVELRSDRAITVAPQIWARMGRTLQADVREGPEGGLEPVGPGELQVRAGDAHEDYVTRHLQPV